MSLLVDIHGLQEHLKGEICHSNTLLIMRHVSLAPLLL